jgi:uracil-DNA glycosylase
MRSCEGVGVDVRPDARKPLARLKQEWSSCARCELGTQRIDVEGAFVFGQGTPGGVMLIGEGPGADEEREGLPFVGRSGLLLRKMLALLGLEEYYLTNIVACRSCSPQLDSDGQPVFRKNWRTKQMALVYKDEPPTPPQCNACLPRLYEEIYIVDPVVIVGLGGKACEVLRGRPITITRDRGEAGQITIPGARYLPVLTEKKQEWRRKVRNADGVNELQTPVEQSEVAYHFIPTLPPAYVSRKLADRGPDSPFRQLLLDLRKAMRTYEMYLETVFGIVPTQRSHAGDDDLQQQLQSEEDAD